MENDLIKIFEDANEQFLSHDIGLFQMKVSERGLCGALMNHLYGQLQDSEYHKYYVDLEYNRNVGGRLKTIKKTIKGPKEEIITINCDLIVHSRGTIVSQDNLIAVEMKKSSRPKKEKNADRERLQILTKDSYDDIWSFDGVTLPEHVCRYALGVYYEINFDTQTILLEYYSKGNMISTKSINLKLGNMLD